MAMPCTLSSLLWESGYGQTSMELSRHVPTSVWLTPTTGSCHSTHGAQEKVAHFRNTATRGTGHPRERHVHPNCWLVHCTHGQCRNMPRQGPHTYPEVETMTEVRRRIA